MQQMYICTIFQMEMDSGEMKMQLSNAGVARVNFGTFDTR